MQEFPVSLVFGAALLILGIFLLWTRVATWRRQKHDPHLDDDGRRFYYARYRRRMRTSGIIALLGCLIPLESVIPADLPLLFTAYCAVLLLLVLWIYLLGIGDFIVTRAHTQAALSRIRGQQLALEKQISDLRGRRSNGHLDS